MPEPVLMKHSAEEGVRELLRRINQAWLERRPGDLAQFFHPDIVMVFPGFTGRVQGREEMVKGFLDFCTHAQVHAFKEQDHQFDIIGQTTVASFTFAMVYERDGQRFRSTGRDVWIFAREGAEWLAIWRTMLDVTDEPTDA